MTSSRPWLKPELEFPYPNSKCTHRDGKHTAESNAGLSFEFLPFMQMFTRIDSILWTAAVGVTTLFVDWTLGTPSGSYPAVSNAGDWIADLLAVKPM